MATEKGIDKVLAIPQKQIETKTFKHSKDVYFIITY